MRRLSFSDADLSCVPDSGIPRTDWYGASDLCLGNGIQLGFSFCSPFADLMRVEPRTGSENGNRNFLRRNEERSLCFGSLFLSVFYKGAFIYAEDENCLYDRSCLFG